MPQGTRRTRAPNKLTSSKRAKLKNNFEKNKPIALDENLNKIENPLISLDNNISLLDDTTKESLDDPLTDDDYIIILSELKKVLNNVPDKLIIQRRPKDQIIIPNTIYPNNIYIPVISYDQNPDGVVYKYEDNGYDDFRNIPKVFGSEIWLLNSRQGSQLARIPERDPYVEDSVKENYSRNGYSSINSGHYDDKYLKLLEYIKTQY